MASSNRLSLPALAVSSGLQALMAAASASLALAACGGGGDSTVQTRPTPVPPVKKPPTRDCTAVPRPAGCPEPEPVVPMPLEGLSLTERVLLGSTFGEVLKDVPLRNL